ncbi:hypothetical protein ALC53_04429 [Atta colombica]|uniref:Uncharacterized protein n=1 Tax=Atta colombica TaxID=520822 RepID=A0A195BK37_9HYME|nr:hypothetical protein ALC53_04429 [Atta colombica]
MHQTRDRNTKAGSLSTIEDGRFSIVHQTDISTGLSRLLDRQSWRRKRAEERQSESARREIRPLKIAASAEGIAVNRVIEAYSRQKPIDKTQVLKLEPTDQRAMILEVSHRVTDEGCMAKMFAGTTPSITVRKQEYEGEALWDIYSFQMVSIVVHSTAVESPIRFCPLAAAGHAARSILGKSRTPRRPLVTELIRRIGSAAAMQLQLIRDAVPHAVIIARCLRDTWMLKHGIDIDSSLSISIVFDLSCILVSNASFSVRILNMYYI